MPWHKAKPKHAEPVPHKKTQHVKDVPHGTLKEEVEEQIPLHEHVDVPVEKKEVRGERKFGERKFSGEDDHQGAHHPLCLGCNHREDMHHGWQSEQVLQDFRDTTGKVSQRLVTIKHKDYDGAKPCQHACKCTEYQ